MIVIKLGGSVITYKNKENTFNARATKRLAKEIAEAGEKIIIVHGAGSFGHPQAKEYELHKGFVDKERQIKGISLTHASVRKLNMKILDVFISLGINAVSLPPFPSISKSFLENVKKIADMGLTPVTFGDVLLNSNVSIISGDKLMELIALHVKAERAIFVTDVDGIYGDMKKDDSLFKICTPNELEDAFIHGSKATDVTSGMAGKVKSIKRMAYSGVEVHVINGKKPRRLFNAIKGKRVGTMVIPK
ncbi:MAG: isopentenyl phosphate kinase family protein [Thermoplasmata archaeon]|nr:MAG: isopentenyl phosphate kinase family protein [Thermoplasmata archaeon]